MNVFTAELTVMSGIWIYGFGLQIMLAVAQFADDQLPQIDSVFLTFNAGCFKGFDSAVVQVLHLSCDIIHSTNQKTWRSELVKDRDDVCHDSGFG